MKSSTSKKGITYSIYRNLSTSFLDQYKTGRHCSPQRRRFERLQEITETVVYGFDGCLKKIPFTARVCILVIALKSSVLSYVSTVLL